MHSFKSAITTQSAESLLPASSTDPFVLRPALHLAMPLLQQAGLSDGIASYLGQKKLERDNLLAGGERERITRLLRR